MAKENKAINRIEINEDGNDHVGMKHTPTLLLDKANTVIKSVESDGTVTSYGGGDSLIGIKTGIIAEDGIGAVTKTDGSTIQLSPPSGNYVNNKRIIEYVLTTDKDGNMGGATGVLSINDNIAGSIIIGSGGIGGNPLNMTFNSGTLELEFNVANNMNPMNPTGTAVIFEGYLIEKQF